MSARNTTRASPKQADRTTGMTDWERVDRLTDEEIDAAIAEDPDTFVPDEAWWQRAVVVPPDVRRRRVTLWLDDDVIAWFRKRGRGYHGTINHALRRYIQDVERDRKAFEKNEGESAAE